jgi:broad specificity phosphatase PhoE
MVLPRRDRALVKKSVSGPQVKVVHVVRHGEAEHNVSDACLEKRNTQLTARGKRQARSLRRNIQKLKPEAVITSPILRAMQTARAMAPRTPTIVVPGARERIACKSHLCDLPVDPKRYWQSKQFGGMDWSLARGVGTGKYQKEIMDTDLTSWANVERRGRELTRYLLGRPESTLAVVSHGGFLMGLTGDWYMDNCEVRTYLVTGGRHVRWKRVRSYASPRGDA